MLEAEFHLLRVVMLAHWAGTDHREVGGRDLVGARRTL